MKIINNFQNDTVYVSQDGGHQFHGVVVPFGSVVGCYFSVIYKTDLSINNT